MPRFLFAILFTCFFACNPPATDTSEATTATTSTQPIDLVDPFIDTHQSRWFYFNSASRPFGMVNLSPDTNVKGSWESGYLYDTDTVRCFSHVHAWQLSGIPVMPITGEMIGHEGMDSYKSHFSHDTEVAKPGYHKLTLDRYDVDVELTSTTRVGIHHYVFKNEADRYVLFDTGAFLAHSDMEDTEVTKVSDTEIEGYTVMGVTRRRPKPVKLYFVAQFDQAMSDFGGWNDGQLLPEGAPIKGDEAGAFAKFDPAVQKLQMKVAISYTSLDNARKNLASEAPNWDFAEVKNESFQVWNDWLSKIKIEGGTEQQQVKFYTDLWHALQGRRIVSDVNGDYLDNTGSEPQIRQVALNASGQPKYPHYNYDAWWGSHWSLNILWPLAYPEVVEGFCNTMIDMYDNGGMIPRGPSGGNYTFVMIGDPSTSFFAAAYNKGIRDYDLEKAYAGLRKNAFPGGIRDKAGYEHEESIGGGMEYYVSQGYVPEGIEGEGYHRDGCSMTLEYAYQDWCLAQMSKAMGKDADYELFMARSKNYQKVWNPESGFMHPRETDGSWIKDFAPVAEGDFNARGFCEANSAIYTHYVPHDMSGLAQLVSEKQPYVEFLNSSFEKAQQDWLKAKDKKHAANWVDYGNQPGTAMAHLFNKTGAPWLSQKWVREIKNLYGDTTPYGGYYGDEDQGQMGALGVLLSIGLFSVDGGAAMNPSYEITTPIFDKVTIELDPKYYQGKEFSIVTNGNPTNNIYIQSASLNGKTHNSVNLSHEELAKGGTLTLQVGPEPNKQWGK